MKKIIELTKVYIVYPDEFVKVEENEIDDEYLELSIEELKERLENASILHK